MIFLNNNYAESETAVALGIFDGVHLGHRKILSTAKKFTSEGLAFAVFTFEPSSVKQKHGMPYEYIYSQMQKKSILENLGTEYICNPYIEEVMDMSGEEFAERILSEKMKAKAVVCGENFRFGKNASCGAEELKKFGEKYGFEVRVCSLLKKDGTEISSGIIRECLKNGRLKTANQLLGENYFIKGEVVTGNRIGRTIDFPTINQIFEKHQVIPEMGVYASVCEIGGKKYKAVTNIGVKPTVEKNIRPLAETHISGFSGDLYGKVIKTELIEFLREEKKFSSLDELKKQIQKDIHKAMLVE